MTTPMPETRTYVLQNQGGTDGTMKPIGAPVYIPVSRGVANVVLSWSGGYDAEVMYAPNSSTSGAWRMATFTGQVEAQTESLEIPVDVASGAFYVRSRNTSSGNVEKPLGLMVTWWPA